MDQPNQNPASRDPNDLAFNVMPTDGKNYSSPPPDAVTYSGDNSSPPSRRWMYILIVVIVLAALGGAAYYFLGTEKTPTEQQQATSRLPKVWLNQYFNTDTCTDTNTCGDDADPENDGLKNYDEFKAGTNPLNPDTDTDGLADGDEMNIYKIEPTLKYTDRREVVAQNNWTDGFQIKNGYDPLTPALKFTEARKTQIAADTTTFKLHEPSVTTLMTTTTPPPASSDPTEKPTITNTSGATIRGKTKSNYMVWAYASGQTCLTRNSMAIYGAGVADASGNYSIAIPATVANGSASLVVAAFSATSAYAIAGQGGSDACFPANNISNTINFTVSK